MSNSDGNFLALVMLIGTVASAIASGVVAWDWISPDSFGEAIVFIIVWGILGKVFDIVLVGILIFLFDKK